MSRLEVGTSVEARYGSTPVFYPGRIDDVREDRYWIKYDDGDEEEVDRLRVRLPGQKQRRILEPGTLVDAKFCDDEVRRGLVLARHPLDEIYDIQFGTDENDVVQGLERKFIFGPFIDGLSVGTHVEIRFKTTPKFYPGKITTVGDTSFGITYDDGDTEDDVCRRRIRLPGQRQRSVLDVNDAVDARRDDGKVLPGRIVDKIHRSITFDGADHDVTLYDVHFLDGSRANHLERKFIFSDFLDDPVAAQDQESPPVQEEEAEEDGGEEEPQEQDEGVASPVPEKEQGNDDLLIIKQPPTTTEVNERRRPEEEEDVAPPDEDKTMTRWTEGDCELAMRLPQGCGQAAGATLTPCGRVIAASSRSRISLWLASGVHLGNLCGHSGRVLALASAEIDEGPVLVSGGSDAVCCVWILPKGRDDASDDVIEARWRKHARKKKVKTLRDFDGVQPAARHEHPRGSWVLGVDVAAGLLATSASDGVVRLFKPLESGVLMELDGHHWYATAVKLAPGGCAVASASMDKTVRVWFFHELEDDDQSPENDDTTLDDPSSSDDDKNVTTEDRPKKPRCVELTHDETMHSVTWTPDGERLVGGGNGGQPVVWASGKEGFERLPVTGQGHVGPIIACEVSRDGTFLVTAAHDGTARFWDLTQSSIHLLHIISCVRTGGRFVGATIDDGYLGLSKGRRRRPRIATLSADGTLRVWRSPGSVATVTERRARSLAKKDCPVLRSQVRGVLLPLNSDRIAEGLALLIHGILRFLPDRQRTADRKQELRATKRAARVMADAILERTSWDVDAIARLVAGSPLESKTSLLRAAADAAAQADGLPLAVILGALADDAPGVKQDEHPRARVDAALEESVTCVEVPTFENKSPEPESPPPKSPPEPTSPPPEQERWWLLETTRDKTVTKSDIEAQLVGLDDMELDPVSTGFVLKARGASSLLEEELGAIFAKSTLVTNLTPVAPGSVDPIFAPACSWRLVASVDKREDIQHVLNSADIDADVRFDVTQQDDYLLLSLSTKDEVPLDWVEEKLVRLFENHHPGLVTHLYRHDELLCVQ